MFALLVVPVAGMAQSTQQRNFDLARNNYVIPIGAGVGKVFAQSDGTTINIFAEPQWAVVHHGAGQPKFQLFAGFNLQFLVKKQ